MSVPFLLEHSPRTWPCRRDILPSAAAGRAVTAGGSRAAGFAQVWHLKFSEASKRTFVERRDIVCPEN